MTEVGGTSCPPSSPFPKPGTEAAQLGSSTIMDAHVQWMKRSQLALFIPQDYMIL